MTYIDAILLGILQGLTEFLPVSSDGHLVVVQYVLGYRESLMAFDVFIHIGTLIAVILYYRRKIATLATGVFDSTGGHAARRLVLLIVLASIPTAAIGLGLKDLVEGLFTSPVAAALGWLFTGGILLLADRAAVGTRGVDMITPLDAILMGAAQGVAVLPGVSRSGSTVAVGIFRGLRANDAADFSFLIAIPAIIGASLLQLGDLGELSGDSWSIYLTGGVVAGVVGYAAIWGLLKLLERRIIQPFGWYCVVAALVTLIWYGVR